MTAANVKGWTPAPLKSCSVRINYSVTDGFSSNASFTSKGGTPAECLATAADELARIAELFGCGDAVEVAVTNARQRVREWSARATGAATKGDSHD